MPDVSVKMGVSGVAQFKKGMKESQAAVKTLEAALKLNETAMKDYANQEQYLQNKTELLTYTSPGDFGGRRGKYTPNFGL